MAVSSGGSSFEPGRFLVQRGLITQEQLDAARACGGDGLGRLVEDGSITEHDAAVARLTSRGYELGMAVADLSRHSIDIQATLSLPSDFAREHGVLPVKLDGKTLWAAFRDPGDRQVLAMAQELSGCRVIPVLALQEDIEAGLQSL